ncbi:MAG: glycosyltransferase [Thermoproteales archaeon]|nr:glycosyltransferase [Thermoproteales archaeon]
MIILHVSWEYPPFRIIGELAWKVQEIVRNLRVFCRPVVVHPGPENKQYKDDDIEVIMFRDTGYLRGNFIVYSHELVYGALTKLPYFLSYRDFPLIHGHDWIAGMIALALSRAFKKPFILSIYSTEQMRSNMDNMLSLSIESVETYLFRKADLILCHHEKLFDDLRERFGKKVIKYNSIRDVYNAYLRVAGGRS